MSSKVYSLLYIATLMVTICSAYQYIGCDNPDSTQEVKNRDKLEYDYKGNIKTFDDVIISSIVSTVNNNFEQLYIDAKLEDDDEQTNLIIFTTDNFTQYFREQSSNTILVKIDFECSDKTKRTLLFVQSIKEGNYFAPQFDKKSYVIVVPTPLFQQFELTIFEKISATDYDLTKNDITFSSTSAKELNIIVDVLEKRGKTSLASLKFQTVLFSFTEDIEFSIIATDNGKPPRSSRPAKITIKMDSFNSIPPVPKFSTAIVYGSLTEDFKLNEIELILQPETYSKDVSFERLIDDDDIFELTNFGNVVRVHLTKTLDSEFIKDKSILTLVVEATNSRLNESGKTAVSVLIPKKQDYRFKEGLYKGKLIVKTSSLDIADIEILPKTNEIDVQIEFELEGDLKQSFNIDQYQNIIVLTLQPDINSIAWANITYISLKLTAKIELEEFLSTNIIIDVIHTTLWFDKLTYFGSISSDGDLVLDNINLYSSDNTSNDIKIELLQTDADLFLFKKNGNDISLELKASISSKLENKTLFRVEIEAEEQVTGVKAVCVVVIRKTIEEKVYRFKEGLYKGKLIAKTNNLLIDDIEVFAHNRDLDDMEYELEGQIKQSFNIGQYQNIIVLTLKPDLNPSAWTNFTYVSLKLIATIDLEEIASTNIIIDVIHTVLWFDKPTYLGSISSDERLTLDTIKLCSSDDTTDDVKIHLVQTDASLFLFDKIGNGINLRLKENISSELENKTLFRVEIESEEELTGVKAVCSVVISRTIEEKAYHFKRGLYTGKLIAKTRTINIEDVEFFTNTNDLDGVEFELGGELKESFNIDRYMNIIVLTLQPDINPKDWANITYVPLQLTAKIGLEKTVSTNIIIDVIHTVLWFDKPTYFGSINSDEHLIVDTIKLYSSDETTDDVKIQLLQTDTDLFLFDKIGNGINLRLKENISSELENKTLFRVEIEAEEELTGVKAVCAVVIGRTVEGKVYRFKEGLYKGKFITKTNSLNIEDFEFFTNTKDLDDIKFELEGELKELFELRRVRNIVMLSIKSNSNVNQWANITYTSLKLIATLSSKEIGGTSIIIDVFHTTLRFDKSMHFGSINSDGSLVLDTIKLYSSDDTSNNVKIQLLQADADLFFYEEKGNEIILKLKENIPSELENKTLFRIEIEAEEEVTGAKTACVVLITRSIENKEYRFKEGLYKGTLMAKTNSLDIGEFDFFTNTNNIENIVFELEGQFKESFELKTNHNIVKLSLKNDLNSNIWANTTYISLKLLAKMVSEEIATTIVILDIVHTTLWFDKSIYLGSINSNNSLVLDPIILYSSDNVTDKVKIQLLQTDADLFLFDKIGNEINLKLRENVQNELDNKHFFRVEIEAEEEVIGIKAICVVLIGKTIEGKGMKFEKNFYESEINSDSEFAFDINLDKEYFTENTTISISGQYADLFKVNQIENRISLSLNEKFELNNYNNVSYLWLEVKASSLIKKFDAWTIAVFKLVLDKAPVFEEQFYMGAITKSNALEIPKLVIKRQTWKNSTFVEIIGNYSNHFESKLSENEVHISLRSELPDDIKTHNSIVLLVLASNIHNKGYTVVVVNLPVSRSLSSIFKKSIQSGKITQNMTGQELEMADIAFVNEYNVADFNCKLIGDEVIYFDYAVVSPKNVIKLGLFSKIPEELIQEKLYIIISLQCEHKENDLEAGSTVLFLNLPGTNGCPSPNPPTYVPEFPKSFYNFYAKPSFVGTLQNVRATIRDSDDRIRYFLDLSNEHLSSRLDIDSDSGELFISAIISAGTYFFKIGAENVVTQGQIKVNCRLDVESIIQCGDHAVVSNSHLIKYLDEETEYDNILNTSVGDCKFKIFSMTPSNQEYVYIDPVSNTLRMIPTDREMYIFADMTVPQIRVKLKLNCLGDNNSDSTISIKRSVRDLSNKNSSSESRYLVLADDMIFATDVTILSIILTDINDNYPEFIYPKHKSLVVGFPREDNLMELFSDCIVQVAATDKDHGFNKEIRYSVQPNRHFQIDPKTGKVYPQADAMSGINEVDIIVYATDRDGESGGLCANFTLTIKVLTADHFVLLTFENEVIESVETLIESAKNKTGLSLILVRHAMVSFVNGSADIHQRIFETKSDRFITKIWAYAFEENVPVSSKIIKQVFSESGSYGNISAQTVKEVLRMEDTVVCSQNPASYIYGLGTLAVIVVICIGFIFWKYVPACVKRRSDEVESIQKQSVKTNDQKQNRFLSDVVHEPSYYYRKEPMKILGNTRQESMDEAKRNFSQNVNGSVHEMSYDTENESSTGSSYESSSVSSNESLKPRATVTFNELVQRIHIDDDVKIKS